MYPYFNNMAMGGYNIVNPPQMPQQQPQQMVMRNILTPDQINLLKENSVTRDGFYTPINEVQQAASMCTHKNQNGGFALSEPGSDGKRTCSICHSRFHYIEPDEKTVEQVKQMASDMVDLLETIKTNKGDIDPEIGRQIYQFIEVVKQLPNMWYNSSEYIKRATNGPQNGVMFQNGPSPFGMLNIMYGAQQYYPQPMMQQQPMYYPQPGVPQQPVAQQPVMQAPMQPQAAPQVPVQQYYQPAQQPVQYTPYGVLPPNVMPGAAMSNPIGHVVPGQQAVAPQTPTAPTAAPATQSVAVKVPSPDEAVK